MNRVAVLIPHHNDPDGLRRSLRSIADDDPADIVVVDDGSEDPPEAGQIRGWVHGEREVRLHVLPANLGIEAALNVGLDIIVGAGYEFVARLDCGDCNVGRRFAAQVEFLDANPQILLVGAAAQFVDPGGKSLFVRRMPTTHSEIARFMRSNSAFMHPAVMFRTKALKRVGHYPTTFPAAEDYAFFWRFLEVGEVANLPQVLITYEVDPGSISRSKRSVQLRSRLQVQALHNDGSWRARAGMVRTRALLLVPVKFIDAVKARLYGQP
ncbi:MAG: glycosyltransferase [Candidatus Nanopelagicales bacterium]